MGSTFTAGIVTYSEWPPSLGPLWNPQIRNCRQKNSWPGDAEVAGAAGQAGMHDHLVARPAPSDEPKPVPDTSEPTAATTPDTSDPATCGKITFMPGMPRRAQMSLKLAPAAFTSISTS